MTARQTHNAADAIHVFFQTDDTLHLPAHILFPFARVGRGQLLVVLFATGGWSGSISIRIDREKSVQRLLRDTRGRPRPGPRAGPRGALQKRCSRGRAVGGWLPWSRNRGRGNGVIGPHGQAFNNGLWRSPTSPPDLGSQDKECVYHGQRNQGADDED